MAAKDIAPRRRKPAKRLVLASASIRASGTGQGSPNAQEVAPDPFLATFITWAETAKKVFPEMVTYCNPWLVEGYTVFAGGPKAGKTTMARQLMEAVATGGKFFGVQCKQTTVLYFCFEESERLTKEKLKKQGFSAEFIENVHVCYKMPNGERGAAAVARVEAAIREYNPGLVVIDSFAKVAGQVTRGQRLLMEEHAEGSRWHDLAERYPGMALLMLHHSRKRGKNDSDDSITEQISGSMGVTAAADQILQLLKQDGEYRIHGEGRNWMGDDSDWLVERQPNETWLLVDLWAGGIADNASNQKKIFALLRTNEPKTVNQLVEASRLAQPNVSRSLKKLKEKGMAIQAEKGWIRRDIEL